MRLPPRQIAVRVERAFWAPGRVNLIGEHTDYSGGLVLPAAIDLGVTLSGTAAEQIVLESDLSPGEFAVVESDGSAIRPTRGWGRYVAAVAHELSLLGRPAVGFAGRLRSTLPSGAGLSSSAALEVVIASALCAVADFEVDALELAAACQRAEFAAVGVPCGLMDQAASILGAVGSAIYLDCASRCYETVPLPGDLTFVVIDSCVRHQHEFSGYADRRRELEEALTVLDGRRPSDVSLDEAQCAADARRLDELHWRRLRHVVSENARVRELADVLKRPDSAPVEIGRIFLEGHVSQRDDYEISTPELDWLVERAYDAGAVAARMTGGGFGGSVLVLAKVDDAVDLGRRIARSYRERFAREASVRICVAGDGAGEL